MATRIAAEPRELFALVGCQVYLIRYAEGREDEAAEQIYRWVNDPNLDFEWQDANYLGAQLDGTLASYVEADERDPRRPREPQRHAPAFQWDFLSALQVAAAFAVVGLVVRGLLGGGL